MRWAERFRIALRLVDSEASAELEEALLKLTRIKLVPLCKDEADIPPTLPPLRRLGRTSRGK